MRMPARLDHDRRHLPGVLSALVLAACAAPISLDTTTSATSGRVLISSVSGFVVYQRAPAPTLEITTSDVWRVEATVVRVGADTLHLDAVRIFDPSNRSPQWDANRPSFVVRSAHPDLVVRPLAHGAIRGAGALAVLGLFAFALMLATLGV
jgi:hypothetical protein